MEISCHRVGLEHLIKMITVPPNEIGTMLLVPFITIIITVPAIPIDDWKKQCFSFRVIISTWTHINQNKQNPKTGWILHSAFKIVQHYEIKCFNKWIIYVPITITLFHPHLILLMVSLCKLRNPIQSRCINKNNSCTDRIVLFPKLNNVFRKLKCIKFRTLWLSTLSCYRTAIC